MKREPETLEAKLRNKLTPIYGLAELVIALEDRPDILHELLPIVIENAKLVRKNKDAIDELLIAIQNKPIPGVLTGDDAERFIYNMENPRKISEEERTRMQEGYKTMLAIIAKSNQRNGI